MCLTLSTVCFVEMSAITALVSRGCVSLLHIALLTRVVTGWRLSAPSHV